MFRLLARRFLLLLPTLWLVSLAVFFLSRSAGGDPVEILLGTADRPAGAVASERMAERYAQKQRELGLDKPLFYWTLQTAAFPDTLHRIAPAEHRAALARLIGIYGNWPQIQNYHEALAELRRAALAAPPDTVEGTNPYALREHAENLLATADTARIPMLLDSVAVFCGKKGGELPARAAAAYTAYLEIARNATPELHRWPKFRWNGVDNQYHRWMGRLLSGDLGRSYSDRRPVAEKFRDALRWTLPLNFVALPLILVLGTSIGVYSARWDGSRRESLIGAALFGLFAWPEFLMGSLLLLFFCNPDHLAWFPPRGWPDDPGAGWAVYAWHLFLPLCCSVYGSLAYVSRQVKTSVVGAMREDHLRTARAKGLSERQLYWKHALRSTLSPLATVAGGLMPRLIAGSLVVETVFSVPGTGQLLVRAIREGDYPVVCAGTLLSALLVFFGHLAADVLQASVDPRIGLGKGPT
jgi:peptide/nickel transport system permease protein